MSYQDMKKHGELQCIAKEANLKRLYTYDSNYMTLQKR